VILIDLSSYIIPPVIDYYTKEREPISSTIVRNIIISRILEAKIRYKFSPMVIAMDSKNYWRKSIFPQYKQQRKTRREESKFDWNGFYKIFDSLKEELKSNLPYKFMEVNSVEADDIIYVIATDIEDCLILSSDKDLKQVQYKNPKAKQFSLSTYKYLSLEGYSLKEHIIRGDSGDGIPNIFSRDDVFLIENVRQKSITRQYIDNFKEEELDEVTYSKYTRNRKLIDMSEIPEEIVNIIKESYHNYPYTNGKRTLQNYLLKIGFSDYVSKISML
jgi:5'-3' exonuclease